ncbi:RING-H2 finger protein [Nymphaea thermarum]|nr:RING-H2 finger protein [Nymphaea thermarum]
MGFSVEYSGVVVAQFLHHHAALLLFMVRGLFYWVLRSLGASDYLLDDELSEFPSSISSASSSSWVSAEVIRENLQVVTFASLGGINGCSEGGGGGSGAATAITCAVCLNEFRGKDKVRELRNCCHIFHKKCLDRWLDLDQKTCPLCRTPFLLPASGDCDKGETSWCVEHLLYLFGDDLLSPYYSS